MPGRVGGRVFSSEGTVGHAEKVLERAPVQKSFQKVLRLSLHLTELCANGVYIGESWSCCKRVPPSDRAMASNLRAMASNGGESVKVFVKVLLSREFV